MLACEYNYLNVSVQQDKCVTVGNIFSTICVSDHWTQRYYSLAQLGVWRREEFYNVKVIKLK